MKNQIIKGDCIEELKKFDDNYFDSIVTDPPYEIGFMGKSWDASGIANNPEMWSECLRVLKPGGYLLSFSATRTYHRMTCAIEDSGFEIRDMIEWVYGSGFPKSLNIGKAVDKLQGNERDVVGTKETGADTPNGKGTMQLSKNTFTDEDGKTVFNITKGTSEWEGWGTALKPANEPIVVARKPLSEKNVALNVLKWGTGGINIDECRIGFQNEDDEFESKNKNQHSKYPNSVMRNPAPNGIYHQDKREPEDYTATGRFPANIIFDEEAGKMLDEQSGIKQSQIRTSKYNKDNPDELLYTPKKAIYDNNTYGDKGGASRFFYCAKASKSERNFGCEDMEEKQQDLSRKEGNPGGDNPRNRGVHLRKNNHPTVKPIALMQYLVKLVTPKGGIVLDPFLGSGTTAIACVKEGMQYIGIEQEKDYCKIAEARLKATYKERLE